MASPYGNHLDCATTAMLLQLLESSPGEQHCHSPPQKKRKTKCRGTADASLYKAASSKFKSTATAVAPQPWCLPTASLQSQSSHTSVTEPSVGKDLLLSVVNRLISLEAQNALLQQELQQQQLQLDVQNVLLHHLDQSATRI